MGVGVGDAVGEVGLVRLEVEVECERVNEV